jgi:glutamate synthase (NADPH/NADH) small chain
MEETPIPIARLQRYPTEKAIHGKWPLFQRSAPIGKKVAVVGAGPSGLSAAHVLARAGVDVTIYEKEPKGGGLMTYGIAAYKVTPEFCAEELEYILPIGGIDVRYDQELGRNLTLKQLREEYDAVYLAFGVGLARQLDIPGEQLEGVVDAIKFIYSIRAGGYPSVPVGDKVAVIGMGMTAIDAATQARRLGAKEVTLVYRRTQAEMPCTQAELDIAKLDGCNIVWLAAPKTILGDNGSVTQLICSEMELGSPDTSGRRSPVDTGRTIILDVDMVIKAAGQIAFEELVAAEGLRHTRGRIDAVTNIAGVFAGGDNVNGGKEVVDAVQAGKDAAAAILNFVNHG